jgi:ABC-2 type transport system permease protein
VREAFPFLLRPVLLAGRNRARRRERGDAARGALFGGIALGVAGALFGITFYLCVHLLEYEELGEYLVRLGLSWLFLTFLSFVLFSSIVTALSTFFLSEDLKLLLAAPVPQARLFYSRYCRTAAQASWMVVAFLTPVLLGIGLARCAGIAYYFQVLLTLVPFVLIPVAAGTVFTLLLVNAFPARRARDLMMLLGLFFAVGLVVMLRLLRPERLLSVDALPDLTAFFATLESPITSLLPSFWAGESLFAALQGRFDGLHLGALWTTALAFAVLARVAYGRLYFTGWSKAQEARKARFTRLVFLERLVARSPLSLFRRSLLLKDAKVFLRDTTQWSQLLLLLALALVYLYNFRVLDLDRIPYMSSLVKNAYAFVNLGMAAFVLSAVAVRFVFPAVSAEGPAFWIIRTSPAPLGLFLWGKFWTGLVPTLLLAELLTIVSNQLLGVTPPLRILTAVAIAFMSVALVGLAAGLGACYPRFNAENVTQIAGSYGGVVFMVIAVLFILLQIGLLGWPTSVYLWHDYHRLPLQGVDLFLMAACLGLAAASSLLMLWLSMRRGIAALEALAD